MKKLYLLIAFGMSCLAARAQLQVNGILYIAPGGTVAVVGGDVAATTSILGTGNLLLNGTTPQNLSMNGNTVPQLEIANLANVTFNSNAIIGDSMKFTSGHAILGNSNLIFSAAAASPVTATATRYIVTNGTGVVTASALAANSSFAYPVGFTTASYTPATVINNAATARDLSVRVQDNNGTSPVTANAANGINRVWQVTGSTAGTAALAFTHEASGEGATFTNTAAFVTQQVGIGVWSVDSPSGGSLLHRGTFEVPVSGTTSFFSKSDDVNISISKNTQIDLIAGLQGPMGTGGVMTNDLQNYFGGNTGLLPTADPYGLGATYADINNPSGAAGAVTDWVKVEIRDSANPATIRYSRALLLKTNGHIVEPTGEIPVFDGLPTKVRADVMHRNHLAVLSNALPGMEFRGVKSYDFTTALAQAYSLPGEPDQMVLKNGKWCLWTGDVNQDRYVDNADFSQVEADYQNFNNGYLVNDINLDGFSDNADYSLIEPIYQLFLYSTLISYP
jgi:hypothetical protein